MGAESKLVCPECGGYAERCICNALDKLGIVNGRNKREGKRRREAL